ncbi:MAG TPA: chaplin [Nonomuraea sp.]|nr:chaplin [Nonomuraea sp.]
MLKKTLAVAGAAAMLSLAAPAFAHADVTSGVGGVASGNQLHIPITAPINVCGNAVAVIGVGVAGCRGGADAYAPSHH